jgi:Flp pilus assembly protein TadB
MRRPAETAGAGGGGLAAILIAALGLSPGVAAALVAAAGVIPAVVTWLVTNGGVRGALGALWGGRKSTE